MVDLSIVFGVTSSATSLAPWLVDPSESFEICRGDLTKKIRRFPFFGMDDHKQPTNRIAQKNKQLNPIKSLL